MLGYWLSDPNDDRRGTLGGAASRAALPSTRRREGALLADQVKSWLIADRYVHDRYFGVPYARLHNARLALRRQITASFEQCDLLLTPTLPMTAPKLMPAKPSAPTLTRAAMAVPRNDRRGENRDMPRSRKLRRRTACKKCATGKCVIP